MSPVEQLRAAKALIDTPEKWTKGAFARTDCGMPLPYGCDWDEAVCFCSEGAIRKVIGGGLGYVLGDIMERAVPRGFRGAGDARWFVKFSDAEETTHADVMALFDRAIKLAEAVQ